MLGVKLYCGHDGCECYTYPLVGGEWWCSDHLPPASRTSDAEPSHVAEKNITESGKRASHMALAYQHIKVYPGNTASEIAVATGLTESQTHKRLSDLQASGMIVKTGQRICQVNGTLRATWGLTR